MMTSIFQDRLTFSLRNLCFIIGVYSLSFFNPKMSQFGKKLKSSLLCNQVNVDSKLFVVAKCT